MGGHLQTIKSKLLKMGGGDPFIVDLVNYSFSSLQEGDNLLFFLIK